jgi:DNA-binding NtrC family response regulator
MIPLLDSLNPWAKRDDEAQSLTEKLTQAMLKGKRVLFLDDDNDLCDLVEGIAKKYEMDLVCVKTSGGARALMECEGDFDAAILDINIVNGDGVVLYRWIKAAFPRMQVIFLTGTGVSEASEKVHAVGSAPVYTKPTLWNAGFMEDLFDRLGCRRKLVT